MGFSYMGLLPSGALQLPSAPFQPQPPIWKPRFSKPNHSIALEKKTRKRTKKKVIGTVAVLHDQRLLTGRLCCCRQVVVIVVFWVLPLVNVVVIPLAGATSR